MQTTEEKLELGKEAISLAFAEGLSVFTAQPGAQEKIVQALQAEMDQTADHATTRMLITQAIGRDSRAVDVVHSVVETVSSMAFGWREYLHAGEDVNHRVVWPYRELACDDEFEATRLRQIWRERDGCLSASTRMIAHHQDEIWRHLSRFGLPFTPFDFDGDATHYVRNLNQREADDLALPRVELVLLPPVNFNELFPVLQRELPLFIEETERALAEADEECNDVERKPAWTWNPLLEEFHQLIKRLLSSGALDTAGFLELVEWLRRCPDLTRYPIKQVSQEVENIIADGKATTKEQARIGRLLLKVLR